MHAHQRRHFVPQLYNIFELMQTTTTPVKRQSLVTLLVLPLLVAAALTMLGGFYVPEPWRSLLVNISAGLLGSIITVLYVDQILRRRERAEWANVSRHVGQRVSRLAIATASSVRLALRLEPPSPEIGRMDDPKYIRSMILAEIEDYILPRLSQLPNMTQDEWRIFANNLSGTLQEVQRLLTLFARHMDSVIVGSVLDIEDVARSILGQYQTWPDMLGVPFPQMKPNNRGESMVPYFKAVYQLVVKDCERLLKLCSTILRESDQHFPD